MKWIILIFVAAIPFLLLTGLYIIFVSIVGGVLLCIAFGPSLLYIEGDKDRENFENKVILAAGTFLFVCILILVFHFFLGVSDSFSKNMTTIVMTIGLGAIFIMPIVYFVTKIKSKNLLKKIVDNWANMPLTIEYSRVNDVKPYISECMAKTGTATGREIIEGYDFSFYERLITLQKEMVTYLDSKFLSKAYKEITPIKNCLEPLLPLDEIVSKYIKELEDEGEIRLITVLNQNGRSGLLDAKLYESVNGEPMESETLNFDDL